MMFLGRFGRKFASVIIGSAWLSIWLIRAAWQLNDEHSGLAYFSPVHCTGLLLGSLAAVLPRTPKLGIFGVVLLAFAVIAPNDPKLLNVEILAAEIAAFLVVIDPPKFLRWRPLVGLGAISYGIYLWHIPVLHALGYPFTNVARLEGIALSICLAAVSYLLVERRFLRSAPPSTPPIVAEA